MGTIRKVIYKAERMAAGNSGIYRRMREQALRCPVELPSHVEALAILQAASPQPRGGCNVPPRTWPEEPEVDVSVIVPCYNVENFVEGCVLSITSQETSRAFEVICVDDGSTDSTGQILDSLAAAENSVKVIHQHNRGLSGARNAGIAEARGRGLVFVDSDDLMLPGAIEVLCDAYDEGGCDYVTASYKDLSEDGRTVTPISGKRQHGAPWGRLYSREVWRDLQFPEGFWFEDTVQGFCIAPQWRERYIDVPVYLYRRNSTGITSTSGRSKKGLDTLWIVDEMLQWDDLLGIPFDLEMYDRVIWQLGVLLWARTPALNERERRAMFVYACDILRSCDPNGSFVSARDGRWRDVEHGLRSRNYWLWKMAVMGLLG